MQPTLNPDLCVHTYLPNAHCQHCVDICPHQAWRWQQDSLSLDTARCDGCRLCAAHCPEIAISLSPLPPAETTEQGKVVWLGCESVLGKDANIPCLHAISLGEWAHTAKESTVVYLAEPACMQCARTTQLGERLDATQRWNAHLARVNRVRHANQQLALNVERLAPEDWLDQKNNASRPANQPKDMARRGFFGRLLRPAASPDAVTQTLKPNTPTAPFASWRQEPDEPPSANWHAAMPWSPVLNPLTCHACQACVRICPHDALCLNMENGRFQIYAERCTGCGLCEDVCDVQAISVSTDTQNAPPAIALSLQTCVHCQAVFAQLPGQLQTKCIPCRKKSHPRGLLRIVE